MGCKSFIESQFCSTDRQTSRVYLAARCETKTGLYKMESGACYGLPRAAGCGVNMRYSIAILHFGFNDTIYISRYFDYNRYWRGAGRSDDQASIKRRLNLITITLTILTRHVPRETEHNDVGEKISNMEESQKMKCTRCFRSGC